jgi:hypothetical protein
VAERDDALAGALQRLQRHDEGTLEVLGELERAADGLLTAAAGGAVPEGPLAQANGLADRVAGRLGERADLVRGMG